MPSFNVQNAKALAITEGDVKTIHDSNGQLLWGAVGYSTKYEGDAIQNGNPTPDNPIAVQVVTGEQTVTVSDGTNTEDFTVSLGSSELCKIGTYQDYIWKDGDTWKVHKETGKVVLDGSESWENWAAGSQTNTMAKRVLNFPTGIVYLSNTDSPAGKLEDTHFQLYTQNGIYNSDIEGMATNNGNLYVRINKTRLASVDSTGLKTWFSTHNTTVYYALATVTDTTITDATLIGQLNAIEDWLTRYGYSATVSGSLPLIINQTALS